MRTTVISSSKNMIRLLGIELGGDWDDIIAQAEDISYELQRCAYGIWDHIKNSGDHGAENYELIWVGNHPGIREGRRIEGIYMLTENDILENKIFIYNKKVKTKVRCL